MNGRICVKNDSTFITSTMPAVSYWPKSTPSPLVG